MASRSSHAAVASVSGAALGARSERKALGFCTAEASAGLFPRISAWADTAAFQAWILFFSAQVGELAGDLPLLNAVMMENRKSVSRQDLVGVGGWEGGQGEGRVWRNWWEWGEVFLLRWMLLRVAKKKKKSHVRFWLPWVRSFKGYSKFCANIQLQGLGLGLVMLILAKVFFFFYFIPPPFIITRSTLPLLFLLFLLLKLWCEGYLIVPSFQVWVARSSTEAPHASVVKFSGAHPSNKIQGSETPVSHHREHNPCWRKKNTAMSWREEIKRNSLLNPLGKMISTQVLLSFIFGPRLIL